MFEIHKSKRASWGMSNMLESSSRLTTARWEMSLSPAWLLMRYDYDGVSDVEGFKRSAWHYTYTHAVECAQLTGNDFSCSNFPVTFHAIYTQLHSWFMVVMGILISQFYVQDRLINSKPWKCCAYFVKTRWKVNGKITQHAEWIKLCLRYISSCRRSYSLSTPSARSEKKFHYYLLLIHTFQWCGTPLLTKISNINFKILKNILTLSIAYM